jgi:hypothetical protein
MDQLAGPVTLIALSRAGGGSVTAIKSAQALRTQDRSDRRGCQAHLVADVIRAPTMPLTQDDDLTT